MTERFGGTDDDFDGCVGIQSESDRLIVMLAETLTEPWRATSDPKKTLGELRKEIMECHRQIVLHAHKIKAA
ncbi:MAG: hypothetical protein K0U61_02555 [Alphaproteobacteria bacterium]|nr:hypothetical protein [Alphaproteobacteria bacterium]